MADVPLMNNPMTTDQDIVVGGTSGAPGRLGAGSEGEVLSIVSGDVAWAAPAGGGGVGNLWTMSKNNTSQTLTSSTLTQITFEDATIDGGGSVIDLANDRFVAPATGFYLALLSWTWEATPPLNSAYMAVKTNGTESAPLIRLTDTSGTIQGSMGLNGSVALAAAAGDFITMSCHPGGAATPTARGNASIHLRTTFTLVRIT